MTFEERATELAEQVDAARTPEDFALFLLLAMNTLRSEYPEQYASGQPAAQRPPDPAPLEGKE